MMEMIQLNLTEEESVILQAIVAVGVSARTNEVTAEEMEKLQKRIHAMNLFMDTWPESSNSLADKMTELVKVSAETIGMELK